jgi:hypothetical protein
MYLLTMHYLPNQLPAAAAAAATAPADAPPAAAAGSGVLSSAASLLPSRRTVRSGSEAIKQLREMVGSSSKVYSHLVELCEVCCCCCCLGGLWKELHSMQPAFPDMEQLLYGVQGKVPTCSRHCCEVLQTRSLNNSPGLAGAVA